MDLRSPMRSLVSDLSETKRDVKSIQGKRDYMEDRYSYFESQDRGIIIAFVCDGHGGEKVAEITSKRLTQILYELVYNFSPDYSNAVKAKLIRKTILYFGKSLFNPEFGTAGSTLTGVIRCGSEIYIFNIGDSRTCFNVTPNASIFFLTPTFSSTFIDDLKIKVLPRGRGNNLFCTQDHDTENEVEIQRIRDFGGRIVNKRLNGVLSVTRALGDFDVKPGISYVPDIYWTDIRNVTGPILMYSDGVYEPDKFPRGNGNFSKEHLYYVANKYGATGLVNYAFLNGSEDNITALLVY